MRRDRGPGEPMQPIATVVGVLLALMATGLVLTLFVRGGPYTGGPVCTSAPASTIPLRTQQYLLAVHGLAGGSRAYVGSVNLCVSRPGLAIQLAGLLTALPTTVVLLVFLLRLRSLVLVTGRPGALYTSATAARLRWLGWFLFAGSLAAGILESVAQTAIFLGAVSSLGYDWYEPQEWHLPVGYLVLGIGLISVASVMQAGASRRDEARVTV